MLNYYKLYFTDMYRAKQVHMEKFPEDIIRAERATGGDTEILTRDVFQEVKRERHSGTFGDATNTSAKKGMSIVYIQSILFNWGLWKPTFLEKI